MLPEVVTIKLASFGLLFIDAILKWDGAPDSCEGQVEK